MGNKNQNSMLLNWVSVDPAPFKPNTPPSGVTAGVMQNTDVIYSQIVDVTIKDNLGLEVTWTGTPTGTIEVMGSTGGAEFYALTFDPVLTQPAGSAGGYLVNINQFPWKYIMVVYTNASGNGLLEVWMTTKDLN